MNVCRHAGICDEILWFDDEYNETASTNAALAKFALSLY